MSCVGYGRATLRALRQNFLSLGMLFSIVIGVALGVGLKRVKQFSEREIMYIGFLGDLFLRMLKGTCVPLMVCCIIIAFATMDSKLLRLYGVHIVIFFLVTKAITIALAMTIAIVFQPGIFCGEKPNALQTTQPEKYSKDGIDNFLDMFYNMFPDNFIGMSIEVSYSNVTKNYFGSDMFIVVKEMGTVNMLGLVNFSIIAGASLKIMKENGKVLLDLLLIFNELLMNIVFLVMVFAPIFLVSLVTAQMLFCDFRIFVSSVGKFTLCACGSLLIIEFLLYPIIILVSGRLNPFKLYFKFLKVFATAFGCGSSLATLPTAMGILIDEMKFDKDLVSFAVPVLIAINKDGGASTLSIASIFFAQYENIELEWHQYIEIAIYSVTMSIAAPGVPQSMIMIIIVVLRSLGIPIVNIGIILAVDVLVDRMETIVHVTASAVAVAVLTQRKARRDSRESNKGLSDSLVVVNSVEDTI